MTQEQIKFWEWCGFKWEERAIVRLAGAPFDSMGGWSYPNSIVHGVLPSLDLNNLFKYAVPKVESRLELTVTLHRCHGKIWSCLLTTYKGDIAIEPAWHEDPALALYQALYKIMKEDR